MTLNVTRGIADWVVVIQALQAIDEQALIERIRAECRDAPDRRAPLCIQFTERRDIETIELAIRHADHGRPAWFPPVHQERTP